MRGFFRGPEKPAQNSSLSLLVCLKDEWLQTNEFSLASATCTAEIISEVLHLTLQSTQPASKSPIVFVARDPILADGTFTLDSGARRSTSAIVTAKMLELGTELTVLQISQVLILPLETTDGLVDDAPLLEVTPAQHWILSRIVP